MLTSSQVRSLPLVWDHLDNTPPWGVKGGGAFTSLLRQLLVMGPHPRLSTMVWPSGQATAHHLVSSSSLRSRRGITDLSLLGQITPSS